MHAHMCLHTHVCLSLSLCLSVSLYMHVPSHACKHMHAFACMHTHASMYIFLRHACIAQADLLITEIASKQCEVVVPDDWVEMLKLMEVLRSRDNGPKLLRTTIEVALDKFPSPEFVNAYRSNLFVHIVSTLGLQSYLQHGHPPKTLTLYPLLVQQIVRQMKDDFELKDLQNADGLKANLFVQLHAKSGKTFPAMTAIWYQASRDACDVVESVNLTLFAEKRAKIQADFIAIPNGNHVALEALASSVLNASTQVPGPMNSMHVRSAYM